MPNHLRTGHCAVSRGAAGIRAGRDAVEATLPHAGGRDDKYDGPLRELVGECPGITLAQAAGEFGVHPTALYPVVRRMEARGALVKVGRQLRPALERPARPDVGTEDLWCESGHWWQRPVVRGAKPRRCPEHRR